MKRRKSRIEEVETEEDMSKISFRVHSSAALNVDPLRTPTEEISNQKSQKSMAIASAGLRQAMDRRTRATYSVRSFSADVELESDRSSSIPTTLRRQGSGGSTTFDPALFSSSAARSSLPRHEKLVSPALSAPSYPSMTTPAEPTNTLSSADAPSGTLVAKNVLDNGLSENRGGDDSENACKRMLRFQASSRKSAPSSNRPCCTNATPKVETAPVCPAKKDKVRTGRGGSRGDGDLAQEKGARGNCSVSGEDMHERKQSPLAATWQHDLDAFMNGPEQVVRHSDLHLPEKLMELMEERDRAVQLCLQYRWKLKNTEANLKTSERRASGLKRQLEESFSASGEATKKMLAQLVEGVREELAKKTRVAEACAKKDTKSALHESDDAHKVRMQLVRARKDMRDLWLERDELAKLAGGAMQGEEALRKRNKSLEALVADLQGKIAASTKTKIAGGEQIACAEARAEAAEKAEKGLRTAVATLKTEFKGLVTEINQRDNKILALEEAKAHLVQTLVEARRASGIGAAGMPRLPILDQLRHFPPRIETEIDTPVESKMQELIAIRIASRHGSSSKNSVVVDGDPYSSIADKEEEVVFSSDNGARSIVANGQKGSVSEIDAASDNCEAGSQEVKTTVDRQNVHPEKECINEYPGVSDTSSPPDRSTTKETLEQPREGSSVSHMSTSKRVSWATKNVLQPEAPVMRKKIAPEPESRTTRINSFSYPLHGNRVTVKPTTASMALDEGQHPHDKAEASGMTKIGNDTQDPCQDTYQHLAGKSPLDHVSEDHHQLPPEDDKKEDEAIGGSAATLFPPQPPLPRKPGMTEDNGDDMGDTIPLQVISRRPSGMGGLSSPSRTTCFDISTLPGTITVSTRPDGIVDHGHSSEAVRHVGSVKVTDDPPGSLRVGSGDERGNGQQKTQQDHGATGQQCAHGEKVSDVPRSRLLSGVAVLKHGSGRGKAKGKILRVSPDFSEVFYTAVGRTNNSKATARLPLAELRATKGLDSNLHLRHSRTDHPDRCFTLARTDAGGPADTINAAKTPLHRDDDGDKNTSSRLSGTGEKTIPTTQAEAAETPDDGAENERKGEDRGGHGGQQTYDNNNDTRTPLSAASASLRKWSGGGILAAQSEVNTGHRSCDTKDKQPAKWIGGVVDGAGRAVGAATTRGSLVRQRERLGFEASSSEECDELVDEINELVRRKFGAR